MDDPLYRDEILDHCDASPYRGRLDRPDRWAELENPLCGDRLRIELELGPHDHIARVRFDGEGCVISQAAASLLAEHLEGRAVDEARRLTADGMLGLIGIPLTPARKKCGLLAWRALRTALSEAEGAGRTPSGRETITMPPDSPFLNGPSSRSISDERHRRADDRGPARAGAPVAGANLRTVRD